MLLITPNTKKRQGFIPKTMHKSFFEIIKPDLESLQSIQIHKTLVATRDSQNPYVTGGQAVTLESEQSQKEEDNEPKDPKSSSCEILNIQELVFSSKTEDKNNTSATNSNLDNICEISTPDSYKSENTEPLFESINELDQRRQIWNTEKYFKDIYLKDKQQDLNYSKMKLFYYEKHANVTNSSEYQKYIAKNFGDNKIITKVAQDPYSTKSHMNFKKKNLRSYMLTEKLKNLTNHHTVKQPNLSMIAKEETLVIDKSTKDNPAKGEFFNMFKDCRRNSYRGSLTHIYKDLKKKSITETIENNLIFPCKNEIDSRQSDQLCN